MNVTNTNFFQNEVLATGFDLPTNIEFLPDGRMLVVELAGTIRVLPPPYTHARPDAVPAAHQHRFGRRAAGHLDIALDPNFTTNHFYYVFYTPGSPNRDRLSRFTANGTITGTVAGSEIVLYQDPSDANAEHHGGAIIFGNDGKLYFTTGEHFDASDAQDLTNPRGKIHRINKDGTIPTDNPFYDGAGPNVDSIWALGLRNPYRAYYDAPTGRHVHRRRRRQRLLDGHRGGRRRRGRRQLRLAELRGTVPGAVHEPALLLPAQRPGRGGDGWVRLPRQPVPGDVPGQLLLRRLHAELDPPAHLDANGNVTGVDNFEPADGSVDGPYGDIVYLTEGPDGALYYVDLGYSDIGGTFGVSKIRRIRYISVEPGAGRRLLGQSDVRGRPRWP